MAADSATTIEARDEHEGPAYISPTVDFLVLAVLTGAVALACAAVIIP